MLDTDEQNHSGTAAASTGQGAADSISLTRWVHQAIGMKQARIRSRLRGNNLHILCESQSCPSPETVVPQLIRAFSSTPVDRFLPPGSAQVYRVIIYARRLNQTTPDWTESFYLNPTELQGKSEDGERRTGDGGRRTELHFPISHPPSPLSPLELAQQGQPQAIARYLSDSFSAFGVAIRAKVEQVEKAEGRRQKAEEKAEEKAENEGSAALTGGMSDFRVFQKLESLESPPDDPPPSRRLLVICESAYTPDPALLAEQIAQRLRQLELSGFRYAIVVGQVSGEPRPEWLLRVDLTPPDEILREWTRWGDVQAISHLLNRALSSDGIQVAALLKDATLHLSCTSLNGTIPDKLAAISAIAALLTSVTPQGIHATAIYGLAGTPPLSDPHSPTPSPQWVHWLDLAAASDPNLAVSTLELAQQGDLAAIAFLLTRLLNPDLSSKLATGGIRVQLRQKADLLHIMTDAPNCPPQGEVTAAIVRFLQPLQIAAITGVRIYGRRAGQRQPLWSYGVDFAPRGRLVPEATPEFAASDAFVGDLLSPPGALVLRSEVPLADWRSPVDQWLESRLQRIQQFLIRSQLFVPAETTTLNSGTEGDAAPTDQFATQVGKTALVWGAVGLLLVVQTDWLLGQLTQPAPSRLSTPVVAQPSPPPPLPPSPQASPVFPNLSLRKSPAAEQSPFNSSGFTQPGDPTPIAPSPDPIPASPAPSLTASPFQAKATLPSNQGPDAYPTFNSRQFDIQLAAYRRYVEQYGAPTVLIIGSSRAMRGVDPVALETLLAEQGYAGVQIFNFGINGATAQLVDLLVRQILPQEALPKLLLFADGARAFNSGRQDITFNGIITSPGYNTLIAGNPPIAGTIAAQSGKLPTAPADPASASEASPATPAAGYQSVNQSLNQWLGAWSLVYTQRDRLKSLVRDGLVAVLPKTAPFAPSSDPSHDPEGISPSVLSEGQDLVDVDGFLALSNRFNPATYYQKYARVSGDYDSDYRSFSLDGVQTTALASLAQFAQERQIPLVFVNLPLTQEYLDPTRRRYEDAFQQHMLRLAPQLGFTFRDLGQAFLTQPDYFSDPSHLNRYGAYEVSRRLAQDARIPWSKVQR
jgi:hypothetical protein